MKRVARRRVRQHRHVSCLPAAPTDGASRSQADETTECRAFHVARRRAHGSVPQAVAHGAEFADGAIELLGFSGEQLPVDFRAPVGRKHARDLLKREARGAAKRD
jgi:hypothetical protein